MSEGQNKGMGCRLLLPSQSSKEKTSPRRETRGLVNRKTVSRYFKVLLMISGGLGGGDEYHCRFRGGSRSNGVVGDVTIVLGVSAGNSTRKPALTTKSGSACMGYLSTHVVVSINTITADRFSAIRS